MALITKSISEDSLTDKLSIIFSAEEHILSGIFQFCQVNFWTKSNEVMKDETLQAGKNTGGKSKSKYFAKLEY